MNRSLPVRRSWLAGLLMAAPLAAVSLGCGQRSNTAPTTRGIPAPVPHTSASRPTTLPATDLRPLYDRLGGTPAVTKVVDDFVALAAGDPKVNFTRKGQPAAWDATPEQVALLKKRLVEFISAATGGDLHYNGQDMVTAHRGMNITDTEFEALAADLKSALEKNGVGPREQSELLAVVNRTRSAVVATPSASTNAAAPAAAKPAEAPKPAPFVPTPITSNETELDPETAAPEPLNK